MAKTKAVESSESDSDISIMAVEKVDKLKTHKKERKRLNEDEKIIIITESEQSDAENTVTNKLFSELDFAKKNKNVKNTTEILVEKDIKKEDLINIKKNQKFKNKKIKDNKLEKVINKNAPIEQLQTPDQKDFKKVKLANNYIFSINTGPVQAVNSVKGKKDVEQDFIRLTVNEKNIGKMSENNEINKLNITDHLKRHQNVPIANKKYQIKFKSNNFEKEYQMDDSDLLEDIYNDLFGNDMDRKLLYEGMKLSRFLTAEESGFFPGTNYIYIPDNEILPGMKPYDLTIKFDENLENDCYLSIDPKLKIISLIQAIEESKNLKCSEKMLFNNGIQLNSDHLIKGNIDDGDCIDIVDKENVQAV